MICPYCGEKNPNNARRCENCGRPLTRSSRQRKKERRMIVTGVVLVIIVLLLGVAAIYLASDFLEKFSSDNTESKVTITTKVTPTPTPSGSAGSTDDADTDTSDDSGSDTVSTEPVTAEFSDKQDQIDLMGYSEVTVSEGSATSTIQQYGVDNSPMVLVDGNDATSWQEGVSSYGEGESVTLTFDKEYNVRFIVIRPGNWRSNVSFNNNGRPSQLTFELGDESFTMDFPDEQTEFCIELSADVKASDLTITIDGVYEAAAYQDTCINEVTVYGY